MTPLRLVASAALTLGLAVTLYACSGSSSSSDGGLDGNGGDATPQDGGDASRDSGRGDSRAEAHTDAIVDGGPPVLVELSIAAGAGMEDASLTTLVPPFSPDIHDYYVRCEPVPANVKVTIKASPGALSQITRPETSPSAPEQTILVKMVGNKSVVATASLGTTTTEYWVRCLPSDFPAIEMKVHPEAGTAEPGYYLVGNFNPVGYAMILDGNGVPIWYDSPTTHGIFDLDSVLDGSVSYTPNTTPGGPFEVFRFDTAALTSVTVTNIDHHEFQPLDGGETFLVFAAPLLTHVNLTGYRTPDGSVLGPDASMVDCEIDEVDPKTGMVLWRWFGTDHFDPLKDSLIPEYAPLPGAVDPFHCNSISVDPSNGNLLVSARDMEAVFYIEKSEGGVLWKMGGANDTAGKYAYVKPESRFVAQHDARLLNWSSTTGCGAGQVSVFDDETEQDAEARGIVFNVNVGRAKDGPDCSAPGDAGPATVAWQYKGAQSSLAEGSFRAYPGSRVIGWGSPSMAAHIAFTEVDDAGHDLRDFYFTDMNVSYRAIKVPTSAFDLETLRNAIGKL